MILNFHASVQQEQDASRQAATKGAATATDSTESDLDRRKREADELLKGIIPDDVISGTAGMLHFVSQEGVSLHILQNILFYFQIDPMKTTLQGCAKFIDQGLIQDFILDINFDEFIIL